MPPSSTAASARTPGSARAMRAFLRAPGAMCRSSGCSAKGRGSWFRCGAGRAAARARSVTGDIALLGMLPGAAPAPARRRAVGAARAHAGSGRAAGARGRPVSRGRGHAARAAPRRAMPSCWPSSRGCRTGGGRSRPPPARPRRPRASMPWPIRCSASCSTSWRRSSSASWSATRRRWCAPGRGSPNGSRRWTGRLVSLPDPLEATGAAEQLEEALQPSVPLAGGGSLIIQPTAALTAIDVNGGGRRALEANLAAAREIARQLRLRRIGGTVVVDFVDLPARCRRGRACSTRCAPPSPTTPSRSRCSRCRASAWSRSAAGGAGPSLAEMLGRPCPLCDGAGTVAGLRWRARQLMRELARRPRGAPGGSRRARSARLSERDAGSGGWQAFAARHGGAVDARGRSVPRPGRPSDRGAGAMSDDTRSDRAARGPRAARSAAGRGCTSTGRSARRAVATSISGAGSARSTPCPRPSPATTRTRRRTPEPEDGKPS